MTIEHRRGVVVLALIAAFMVFVDGTIVNLTLAQLASHLHAPAPSWNGPSTPTPSPSPQ